MITLTRLNGHIIAVNPDLITWIEVTPDTTLSLLGGDKIIVRERLEDVIDRVVAFRRSVGGLSTAYPPSRPVMDGIVSHRDRGGAEPGLSLTPTAPPVSHPRR